MPKLEPTTRATPIRPLDRKFFNRDPRRVARELLGKVLVREVAREKEAGRGSPRLTARIVEVEAYLGENDPASHAAAGQTPRNAVLFGPPGHAYVYFIYGTHYCLNVSCEPEGRAGGVLFRALEPLSGVDEMAQARGIEIHGPKDLPKLTSGPGRLSEAFGITRARDNASDLTSPASRLWIGDDGFRPPTNPHHSPHRHHPCRRQTPPLHHRRQPLRLRTKSMGPGPLTRSRPAGPLVFLDHNRRPHPKTTSEMSALDTQV